MTRIPFPVAALAILAACSGGTTARSTTTAEASEPRLPDRYSIGRPAAADSLHVLDIDVDPSGAGLPAGSGTAAAGAIVYASQCAICHGAKGEGIGTNPRLVGREPRDTFPFGNDPKLVKTVGNYWPYATTIYDYVHRAMPLDKPGSMAPGDIYAVVAFLLAENEIIPRDQVIDAQSLPKVRMPAHDRFVPDNRRGGPEVR
jgi:cytochrome c